MTIPWEIHDTSMITPWLCHDHSMFHDASTEVQSSRSWLPATALLILVVFLASFTGLRWCEPFVVATSSACHYPIILVFVSNQFSHNNQYNEWQCHFRMIIPKHSMIITPNIIPCEFNDNSKLVHDRQGGVGGRCCALNLRCACPRCTLFPDTGMCVVHFGAWHSRQRPARHP